MFNKDTNTVIGVRHIMVYCEKNSCILYCRNEFGFFVKMISTGFLIGNLGMNLYTNKETKHNIKLNIINFL